MTRLQRLKMYYAAPTEPDANPTPAEWIWWNAIAAPIRARTFFQALVATAGGLALGRVVMAAVGSPPSRVGLTYMIVFGSIATVFGWLSLLGTKQKQMIRSKRLRDAMMDADDSAT